MDDAAKVIAAILLRELERWEGEGIDIFLHAFTSLTGQVQELRLGEESPSYLPASIQQESCVPDDILQAALGSVSSLTVSCQHELYEEINNRYRADAHVQWTRFFSTARNLKSLTVYVNLRAGDYMGVASDGGPIVFDIMLVHGHMPKLRHLGVVGPKSMPEPVISAHFMSIITRHSATLHTVKLCDVLLLSDFGNKDPAPITSKIAVPAAGSRKQKKKGPKGKAAVKVEVKANANQAGSDRVLDTFRTCLKSLRSHFEGANSKPKEISIKVPYRDGPCRCEHHCAAGISGTDVVDPYTLKCGCCAGSSAGVMCSENYRVSSVRWIHRSELEALARELGMVQKDGGWDFGRYVMCAK